MAGNARDRGRRSTAVRADDPAADAGDGLDRPLRRGATLFWGVVLFDVPLTLAHPLLFAIALPATMVALGLLGLVMASTFVLYRRASAFSNLLEYPMWLVSGLLVPVSLLPFWVEPLSWVLAPTWGVKAVRASAIERRSAAGDRDVLLLSAAYLAIGWFSMANFERPRAEARHPLAHMTVARVFFLGGLFSYRALFNWISPLLYVTTMLGSPLFQILFFAYLGRYAGVEDDAFFVVGNAVQVSAMAGIYGMTMTIANERQFGTLQPLLATPASRVALFLGRGLPVVLNGLVVSAFGFAVGLLLSTSRSRPSSFRPSRWSSS